MRALLFLGTALLIAFFIWTLLRARMESRPGRWQLRETSDGELVTLRAVRRGDEPLLLGSVPIAAPDFDTQIYERRVEAEDKVRALNNR